MEGTKGLGLPVIELAEPLKVRSVERFPLRRSHGVHADHHTPSACNLKSSRAAKVISPGETLSRGSLAATSFETTNSLSFAKEPNEERSQALRLPAIIERGPFQAEIKIPAKGCLRVQSSAGPVRQRGIAREDINRLRYQ